MVGMSHYPYKITAMVLIICTSDFNTPSGQARYVNQQQVDSDSRYLNYLFGTLVSLELSCFDHKG